MALINCPECNNKISDKAINCPRCGYPINAGSTDHINEDTNMIECRNCKNIFDRMIKECPKCGTPQAMLNNTLISNNVLSIHPDYHYGSGLCPYCNTRKGFYKHDGLELCFECNKAINTGNFNNLQLDNINNENAPLSIPPSTNKKNNLFTIIIIAFCILVSILFIRMCSSFMKSSEPNFSVKTDEYTTDNSYGIIYGNAKGINAKVSAMGITAKIENGTYRLNVPLKMGSNHIIVKYIDDNNTEEIDLSIDRLSTKELKKREETLHAINESIDKESIDKPASDGKDEYINKLTKISGVKSIAQIMPLHIILHNRDYSWNEIGNIINNAISVNSRFGKPIKIYIITAGGYVIAEASYRVMSNDYLIEYYYNPADRARFYE